MEGNSVNQINFNKIETNEDEIESTTNVIFLNKFFKEFGTRVTSFIFLME